MKRSREMLAMIAAAVIVVLFLFALFAVDWGFSTATDDLADEQNRGSNAPHEVLEPADGASPSQD